MASSSPAVNETLIENDRPAGQKHTVHSGRFPLLLLTRTHSLHPLQSSNCLPNAGSQIHTRTGFSYQCDHISLSTHPVRAHEERRAEARVNTARFKREATLQLWWRGENNKCIVLLRSYNKHATYTGCLWQKCQLLDWRKFSQEAAGKGTFSHDKLNCRDK